MPHMPFSIVYNIQTHIVLGRTFTSSHIISHEMKENKIVYSATESDNVMFNKTTGDFTINPTNTGKVSFVITVLFDNKYGYNIPIQMNVIDPEENSLQYSYPTVHPYLIPLNPLKPMISIPKLEAESITYCMLGAPNGITIDRTTGIISGKPTNNGRFLITVTAIDLQTNTFLCKTTINMVFYTSNQITDINGFIPGNEMIHKKDVSFKFTCPFIGAPPTLAQSTHYVLSSPTFESTFLADYNISDDLYFNYIVNMSNRPGSFPIRLEDNITGYFLQSEYLFTLTAACFNENTTVLTMVDGEETYKSIKDIQVGDEVVTYKHEIKKITHIGHNTLVNNPSSISDCMYKLQPDSKNYPDLTHDLILLGRHSTLVDELTRVQKRKTNEIHPVDRIDDKVLLITMFNEDFDIIEDSETYTYYHLVLEKEKDKIDRRYGIYVNGGGVIAATSYKADFVKQFPEK